jgi:hypothetical protein
MSSHHVHAEIGILTSREAVWSRVSDHAATPSWVPKVKSVRVEKDGAVHNGVGTIRVVEFRPWLWSTIHEAIVLFEPPQAFNYVLFRGMAALQKHLGRLEVETKGNGCTVRWDVDFTFGGIHPFRLFVPVFLRSFEDVLNEGLRTLKGQLEKPS